MVQVSVIISSFNHADFIGHAIDSVLEQRFQDFEIIISDDASTDSTLAVISEYLKKDPRIQFFGFKENRQEHMKNNCLKYCKGQYIAVLNSDDLFHPEKLFRQVEYLENHPEAGAVFTGVEWIDEEGEEIRDRIPTFSFAKENRDRYEWLNHFLLYGNALCHSSVMMRKELLDKTGHYNRWQALFSDLDLWIRICLEKEIYILPETYTYNRLLSGERNASGAKPETYNRMYFEYYNILEHYYSDSVVGQLDKILPEIPELISASLIERKYLLSRYLLTRPHYAVKFYGLNRMYELFRNPEIVKELSSKYGQQIIPEFYRYTATTTLLPLSEPFNEITFNTLEEKCIISHKIVYSYDTVQNSYFPIPSADRQTNHRQYFCSGKSLLCFFI